jgi:hypothetical protein
MTVTTPSADCEGFLCLYGLESLRNATRMDEEMVFDGGVVC